MSSPVPRDVSQDTLLALIVMLVDLLEEKKVLTKTEFFAHVALLSNQSKMAHPPKGAVVWPTSTLSELDRVVAWLKDRHAN